MFSKESKPEHRVVVVLRLSPNNTQLVDDVIYMGTYLNNQLVYIIVFLQPAISKGNDMWNARVSLYGKNTFGVVYRYPNTFGVVYRYPVRLYIPGSVGIVACPEYGEIKQFIWFGITAYLSRHEPGRPVLWIQKTRSFKVTIATTFLFGWRIYCSIFILFLTGWNP